MKYQNISTSKHGVTHKMAAIVIVVAIITSNFRRKVSFYTVINFKDMKINWKIRVHFCSILKLTFTKRPIQNSCSYCSRDAIKCWMHSL